MRWLATIWPRVPRPVRRPDASGQTPLKLTAISSLARGADQIVARAVCDLVAHPEQRNRYLEVVLPFPQEIYEQDFPDGRDLETFRQLLALDRGRANTHPTPTVLCPAFPVSVGPTNSSLRLTRDKAYADAGAHVVDASEIVIAVWDPLRDEPPGGTAETARYAVERGRVVFWLNPADLAAGPFQLRSAQPMASGEVPSHRADLAGQLAPAGLSLAPIPTRAKQLSRNFHRLAAYNRDPAVAADRLREDVRDEANSLRRMAADCGLPREVIDTIADTLLPHVVRADRLSLRYRGLRDSAAWLWPAAAAGVVSLMAFQIIFLPDHYWLAFIEVVVLLLGYVSYRVSLYDGWHEKWLNDRRLAEGLRGAMFRALGHVEDEGPAGPRRAVRGAGMPAQTQDPLPFHDPSNAWFVATVKRLLRKERRRFECLDLRDGHQREAVAAFINRAWIGVQADYHERRMARASQRVVRSRQLQLALMIGLVVVALLHAFGVGHGRDHSEISPFFRLDLWVAFATISLPAWAAAFHVMSSLDDHERQALTSSQMVPLLRALAQQVARAPGIPHLRQQLAEVERILDLETGEWAESLVDRKPEFTG